MTNQSPAPFRIPPVYLIILFLFFLTMTAFWPTVGHDFVNLDDDLYIAENPYVQNGLTWSGIKWSFTADLWDDAPNSDFWIPLTFLSHLITVEIFGMNPSGHHLVNLLLHLLNTLLLFAVLRQMTRHPWPSAFVASLFAIHPLHVESVAWVTERKDMLSGLFFMLTLLAYSRYAKQPCLTRYLSVAGLFAMGLMAKPMLVTLPALLLLLDYWPLGRVSVKDIKDRSRHVWYLLLEKLPLFVLSTASALITYLGSHRAGSVGSLEVYGLGVRISNALVAYTHYIFKLFWPTSLAVFYPHPGASLSIAHAAVAAFVLILITILGFRWIRTRPYFIVGWLWFLGMLIPVIGILQAGTQAYADRYTYLPYIGLFMVLAWGAADLTRGWAYRRGVLSVAAGMALFFLIILTSRQLAHWQDSITLFEQAVQVTEKNYLAHTNLGHALRLEGRTEEALREFQLATRANPLELFPKVQIGLSYLDLGRMNDAAAQFRETIREHPDNADNHYYLGQAYLRMNQTRDAVSEFKTALRLDPNHGGAQSQLGLAYLNADLPDLALKEIQGAISLAPDRADNYNNLGLYYVKQNKWSEAQSAFREAIKRDPESALAYNNLGLAYKHAKRLDDAGNAYLKAIQLDPDASEPRMNLALIYALQERYPEAIREYLEGLKLAPDHLDAHHNIGLAYERLGHLDEARRHYEEALRLDPENERVQTALERVSR